MKILLVLFFATVSCGDSEKNSSVVKSQPDTLQQEKIETIEVERLYALNLYNLLVKENGNHVVDDSELEELKTTLRIKVNRAVDLNYRNQNPY